MSLTMFLRAPEGIVMAADSRVTEGYTLKGPRTRDDSVKFIQLNEDAGVMTHGLYDIGNRGIRALKESIDNNGNQNPTLEEIAETGRKTFSPINNKWISENPGIDRMDKDVGFIIGGIDRHEMLFKVYSLESPEFIPKLINGNLFLAGQWHVARFLLTKFNNNRSPVDVLKKLAAVSLMATSDVDKTVGGPVRLATITDAGGFQWVNEMEMNTIFEFNGSFSEFFHELLQSSLMTVLNKREEENARG